MKLIYKIARTELRNLFYSPVAWFLTIVFLIQCAVFYTYALEPFVKWQEMMIKNNPNFKNLGIPLTKLVFLSGNVVFVNALQNLYLFLPLLTMGLISREINNGTIKLLYSSPVKTHQIVLGKYLALMAYNLLLVSIVGAFVVMGLFNIQDVEYGILLSSLLGFFLLVCAYTAIGMFMSSLTTYQIVSAISTFMLIFILSYIGRLWQKYDFVRDLTYFLSISGRTARMLQGLITSKDVIYFLVIVFMFIGFTFIKLKGARESKPWFVKTGRYLAVIVIGLMIGYVFSRPGLIGYWDTSYGKMNTLHPNTQQIISELGDEPMEVTLYTNLLGIGAQHGLPEARNRYLSLLWERYLRFKPNIRFRYVYYYDVPPESYHYKQFPGKNIAEIAAQIASTMEVDTTGFLPPEKIRKIFSPEEENYRLVIGLSYKGKTTFIRTFDDPTFWPDEMNVAAAVKRLLQDKMPRILYTSGNLERSIYKKGEREYFLHSIARSFRGSLINVGFDVDTINLETQKIPEGITALVIGDPKIPLSNVVQDKIRQYLADGGNAMFFGEPGKQYVLNPLLAGVGLQLADGILVEPSKDEMPDMVRPYVTPEATALAEEEVLLRLRKSQDTLSLFSPGATEVVVTSDSIGVVKPLLLTLPGKAWLKAGTLVRDSVTPMFSPQEGDLKKTSFPVVVALERQINHKSQRIIAAGDADMMSSLRGGGSVIGRSYFSWMDNNRFPIYAPHPAPQDTKLNLSVAGFKVIQVIYIWVLPALILLLGVVILLRRKRK
ncbi:Gldg family protein [Chitinophaga defluvii]|uniref:Gldg family protein n=1 Tax=Chitinophaga defluvii TaxID=3163343 RepID=A0ABV2T398_9BACT